MLKKKAYFLLFTLGFFLFHCSGKSPAVDQANKTGNVKKNIEKTKEVNIYTHRHYDTDKKIFDNFTKKTGIKVNVVKAKADQLIKRLELEGKDSPADLLITSDAGRLYRAVEKDLLQSVQSPVLEKNVPLRFKDKTNKWFGMTYRARVLVYHPDRISPDEIKDYESLTDESMKGRVLVRSSGNIYNQSLMAGMIASIGKEKSRLWAEKIVENMARRPKGNDRDQAKAIFAGVGDVALINSYYIGKMLNSSDPREQFVAKALKVHFPNQDGRGTHVNVSGVGLVKSSKNRDYAVQLMEYLTSSEAQKLFADANFEYPCNPAVKWSELVQSWGQFKADETELNLLGKYNSDAVKLYDQVGWK